MPEMKFCPWCAALLEKKIIDGVERKACPSADCDYVFWDNPTPIVAAIVEMEGAVILVRNQGWPEKWFGLVSGFLEKGETSEQGVVREIKEELDLVADEVTFLGLYPFFERNELILAYHVSAHGDIVTNEEIAEYRVIPVEKLKPWPFGTGKAVSDWLEKRGK